MAEDKGTFFREFDLVNILASGRIHHKEGVSLSQELLVALLKGLVEAGRNILEGTFGRLHLKVIGANQVDGVGTESISAAKYLSDVERRFKVVQDNDEIVLAWLGKGHIVTAMFYILSLRP